MESTDELFNYLKPKLKDSINQRDLNNLCFALFCSTDILPQNLKSLRITKDVISQTFMKLAIAKRVDGKYTENDWVDLIDKSIRLGKLPNFEKARTILEIE